jgi:hypothetical protein
MASKAKKSSMNGTDAESALLFQEACLYFLTAIVTAITA